jgi:hypothetical protein
MNGAHIMTERPAHLTTRRILRSLIIALSSLLVFALAPAAALAQGSMDFGVEDVDEDDSDDADDGGDGGMDFGVEEVEEGSGDAVDGYKVAVIAVPSPALSREERIELQEEMRQKVSLDVDYQPTNSEQALQELELSGIAECVPDSLCLADVGYEAGVDRILLGRVTQESGGLKLSIDLFDVEERLFLKYTEVEGRSNFSGVIDGVEPAMKDIFDIRIERDDPNYGDETDAGAVQRILAYTAGGMAVASLGAGIYFGTQASATEDDILSKQDDNGSYTISQVEANRMVRDAESQALTANVLYGTAAGLAIISGILFYVESGSDVAEPDNRRRAGLIDRIDLAPSVGANGLGFGASFDF